MSIPVTIIDSNEASRTRILEALRQENIENCTVLADFNGKEGVFLWIGDEDKTSSNVLNLNDNDRFFRPVRLGDVLDRIRWHRALKRGSAAKIMIGRLELDDSSNEVLLDRDRAIRLTDKEKQILLVLKAANGRVMERQELLEKIWAYAPDLETHTLETHIYRLRQKIERDPAKPEILVTDGTGYRLA